MLQKFWTKFRDMFWKPLWNTYKSNFKKDILVHILVMLGIFGMVCILASSCLESEHAQEQAYASGEHASISELSAMSGMAEDFSQETYRLQLQQQLEEMLSHMAGVGETQVLITMQGSEAYHYAQEADSRYVTVGGSQKQALLESVSHPEITGVVIACAGGGRGTVQETVYQAVSVACGLHTSQIYVTQLGEGITEKES